VKISINPTKVKLQIIAKNTIFKTINIVKFGINNISKNPYIMSQIAETINELVINLIKIFFGNNK